MEQAWRASEIDLYVFFAARALGDDRTPAAALLTLTVDLIQTDHHDLATLLFLFCGSWACIICILLGVDEKAIFLLSHNNLAIFATFLFGKSFYFFIIKLVSIARELPLILIICDSRILSWLLLELGPGCMII